MDIRIAGIPYPSAEQQVADVVPLLYFDNKYVFLRGLTGGIKLYTKDQLQFNLIGRYRFFDIPAEFQNEIRGSGTDLGLQARYYLDENIETNFEIMSDNEGRPYSSLNGRYYWESGS